LERDVAFETRGRAGIVTLRRPRALNALTLSMVREIAPAIAAFAADRSVELVIVRGEGKAFCAGGDVRAVRDAIVAGDHEWPRAFFDAEYRLDLAIARYPKPWVALLDGVAMGGGLGISVHGSHRIVTERSVLAMPETAIGLIPDVGGTFFLSRCPGELGTWLATTGARVSGREAIALGLATHLVPSDRLGALVEALAERGIAALATFATEPEVADLFPQRALVDRLFAGDDPVAILARLAADPDPFAQETHALLRRRCPWSIAATLDLLRAARARSIEECLRVEYRAVRAAIDRPDFLEGIRAVLVDKDDAPRWSPAAIEELPAIEFPVPAEGDWSA
jgi:enoyl-CoA hydratase